MASPLVKKILTVSDLHSYAPLYEQLRAAVERHRPDILACVGDILDWEAKGREMLHPHECAEFIGSLPVSQVLFVRGNHEHWNWFDFVQAWKARGRDLVTLHGEAFCDGPLVITGFPCLLGDEDAFRGIRPMFGMDPSEWLEPLAKEHGAAMRTLWLMHEPPLGTPLSVNSPPIGGNSEWMEAVERYQPKLVVFGHDHNTSRQRKIWWHRLENGTVCVNMGQDSPLRYAVIEIEFESERKSLPKKMELYFPSANERVKL